ncbi:hypothetical protein DEU36_2893 [Microbacterium sp. AG238]|nr:hypothetical protein DEU36_2893 [Microbacterium sp. AG238]
MRLATAAAKSDPADEAHEKRHQDYDGWVLGPASEARFWELRNQTGETVTVEGIVPSGPYWPFEWEEPSFPVRLAPGGSVSIRARKLRSGNHLLPWMNDAMANVVYEDEHGDEREAIIWILD